MPTESGAGAITPEAAAATPAPSPDLPVLSKDAWELAARVKVVVASVMQPTAE